jgi:putative ABC transport system permease protein
MFTLLWQVSIPEIRKHLLRNILTLAGIVLGVAIFVAVRSANSSLKAALRDTIDQIAGKAVLEVTAGPAGMPESTVDEVRAVPGVSAAVPVIEAVVHTTDPAQGNILILGVDMAGDRSMRDYSLEGESEEAVSDPLLFIAQPDSLIVSKQFASRNKLKEDDSLELNSAAGKKKFVIRGIMTPRGMAQAFGGNVGVMDIYSAQYIFNRGKTFDRIDVAIQEGIRIDDVIGALRSRLGPGYTAEPPIRRGKQTESLMDAFTSGLFITSVLALAIGLFLIFNAFAVSVTQRRTQIGILRALGTTRAQIQGLFLYESLVLGAIGSLVGVIVGLALGRGMMLFLARVVEQTYGVQVHIDRLQVDSFWTSISLAMGLAASLIGGYLPSRAAGRVDPALALQKGKFQVLYLGENRHRRWWGLLLLIASITLGSTRWGSGSLIQIMIFGLMFVSLSLLAPTFSHLLATLLRRPMERIFGVEGRLASDSLVLAPRRTSATVSALMFGLAFVLIIATFSVSSRTSIFRWVDASINPDMFVWASESITVRNFQLPATVGEELKGIPGIRQVDAVRIVKLDYSGRQPLLISIEMDQFLRRSTVLLEEGHLEDLLPGMQGKQGVLISNNLARMHRLKKGSRITLDSPTGRHEFEVVGIQADYTSDSGSMLIDREVYKRLWRDDRVDAFDLMLEKGYDSESVKQEIHRRFADGPSMFVMTNQEMRSELLRITDQFFVLQYVQLIVAVLVAVLGIINSLMVSITERKREIGILRGLGGEKHRVRKAILLEAMCIGLVALVLGVASGTLMSYYMIQSFVASFNGWVFPYQFPLAMTLSLVPGVMIVAVLAAWYPSSVALRTPIVEALAYE